MKKNNKNIQHAVFCWHINYDRLAKLFFDMVMISGVLLKMEVGIRKGAWQRARRYPAYL